MLICYNHNLNMRYFAISLMIFFLVSCDKALMLDKKDWQWIKNVDPKGQVIEPNSPDKFVISLDYEAKSFTARTDCNRFFGGFSIKGKNIAFSNIGSTRMFCKDSQERIFIDQLASSVSYVLESSSNAVILSSRNGSKIFLKSL